MVKLSVLSLLFATAASVSAQAVTTSARTPQATSGVGVFDCTAYDVKVKAVQDKCEAIRNTAIIITTQDQADAAFIAMAQCICNEAPADADITTYETVCRVTPEFRLKTRGIEYCKVGDYLRTARGFELRIVQTGADSWLPSTKDFSSSLAATATRNTSLLPLATSVPSSAASRAPPAATVAPSSANGAKASATPSSTAVPAKDTSGASSAFASSGLAAGVAAIAGLVLA
ncbi:hypothetical protein HDU86_008357 [Geranomyces michiganensis]|nr:hypothetical protein HDU86_008357 [Geranomyces michiganensis]